MAKTDPVDPNVPAGSEDPKLGDNRIRELAAAVAELLAVNHYMGTDGGAGTGYSEDAAGEHRVITLRVESAPSAEASKGKLYAKDVSDKAELCFKDEDGDEIQLTVAGILNSLNLTGNQTAAGIKTLSSQLVLPEGLTAAKALVSTLASGTAPLTVASPTKVTNLNADAVDGFHVPAYAGAESYTYPGGRIEKLGAKSCTFTSAATNNAVSFAQAFPNSCEKVLLTLATDNVVSAALNISARALTTVGFDIRTYSNNAFSADVSWLAIGY